MIEKLVGTAATAYDRYIGGKKPFGKINYGAAVFVLSRDKVVLREPLKARHGFVSLGFGILVWIELIFRRKGEDAASEVFTFIDELGCEVEVLFFSRDIV